MIAVLEPFECETSGCAGKTWTVLWAFYDTRLVIRPFTALNVWWRCTDCYEECITGGLLDE